MGKDDDENPGRKGRRKNPWGQGEAGGPPRVHRGPWGDGPGGGGGYGGGPNLDDLLRAAREGLAGPGGDGQGVPLRFILLGLVALVVLWAATGLYMVGQGESAVILRFGALERVQDAPGLGYHMPWPIETARVVNMSQVRNLNIGFTLLPTDQKRVVQAESLILTADRNIVDIHLTVQWYITSAPDYLFQIADPQDTLKKVTESALREVVGQTEMVPLMGNLDALAQATREIIQENLDTYRAGIAIDGVQIGQLEVHPDAQAAFQDVQSAKQDAESAQNEARAYRNKVVPQARGQAAQVLAAAEAYKAQAVALAQGGSARFTELYEAYTQGREVTRTRLYIEMMEAVLRQADTIVLDSAAGGGAVPYLSLGKTGAGAQGGGR
jgi:modulator of FtsH protease HflK